MLPKVRSALVRFWGETEGAVTVDSIVMMAGLVGLALAVMGAVGSGMESLSKDTSARIRLAVVSPGFDTSACPQGWQKTHAENTGMREAEIRAWHGQERRDTGDVTLMTTLTTHAEAPLDFRYRDPMALAHLQILMCLAKERDLDIP